MQFLILLSSLNEEDRTFIEALYYRYGDFMYKTALDILHDSHDAEDAVIDAMCKIIMKNIIKHQSTSIIFEKMEIYVDEKKLIFASNYRYAALYVSCVLHRKGL